MASTTEELEAQILAEMESNPEAYAEEESNVLVIDNDLRTIAIPEGIKNLGVESDDDVHRLYFQMPKVYGEFDLSTFDIRINYKNGNIGDAYAVEDKKADGDVITFSWLVGRNAVRTKGTTQFIVCLKKSDSSGIVQQEFNTTVASLNVLEGLETTEQVIQANADIIEQILKKIDGLTSISSEDIANAVADWMIEHPPSGMTAEEKEQLRKNTEDISSLSEEIDYLKENGTGGTTTGATANPLKGKYLSVLGDSISTYPDYIPEGYSCYYATNLMNSVTYMWWHRLITATGMKLLVNNAYSGSCVAVKTGVADGFSGCNTVRNMRLHTEDNIPDIIVIQMGTNDYVQNIPVGEYDLSDGEVFDTSTFMGAYAKMLWNINDKYPNTKVYCGTLPKLRNNRDTDFPVVGIEAYNEAIRKVADMFGADIVDFTSCGITSVNVPNYMIDGRMHPNKDGQALMANKAIEDIQPFNTTRYDALSPIINYGATLDDGDEGGSGSGVENPDSGETEITLSSISATYTGGEVTVGTALTSLTGITVTGHYSDGSTQRVTGYTLSGTIVEGSNTITVSYGGLTTTFTVTGVAESGGEDSGGEDTQTYLASYDFTGGNSNDLVGTMHGTDTEIAYSSDGAVFGTKSLIAFGKYDLTQKTVELDIGEVTGASGFVFVPNNFGNSLYKGLKFTNGAWTFMDAANGTNTSEITDVQTIANKTIKFVYGAKSGSYIPCSIHFGNVLVLEVEKAAYTGGYLFLGNKIETLNMTIKAMRIYTTV